MFTTKNNNAATRTSLPVVLTGFEHDPHTGGGAGSLYAFCADGTRRICRINRCESIQYARELYAVLRNSIGKRLIFSAAGGNDPRTWFFDVKVIEDPTPPVYDDTPDFVHGMKVEEEPFDLGSVGYDDLSDYELGMPYEDEFTHFKLSDFEPSQPDEMEKVDADIGFLIRDEMARENLVGDDDEPFDPAHISPDWVNYYDREEVSREEGMISVESSIHVVRLLATLNKYLEASNTSLFEWMDLRESLRLQRRLLESRGDYELTELIVEKVGEITDAITSRK
jgi:hypothetical protein